MYRGHIDQIAGLMVKHVVGEAEGVHESLLEARWMVARRQGNRAEGGWL